MFSALLFLTLVLIALFGRHDLAPGATMAIAPLIAAAAINGAGGVISSAFGKKKNTISQVPLETPEQAQARRDLLGIGESGTYNGTTLGDQYSGPTGDYTLSPTEQAGQGLLANYVNAGRPQIFDAGVKTLNDLLTTNRFDPNDPNGEYAAYKAQAARDLKDSITTTKRNLAYTGDLYSTDSARQIGRQVSDSQIAQNSKLADLTDQYVTRKLNAIPLAGQLGQEQEQLDLMPITAAATYGGAQRTLNTQQDQANLAEWIRARQEKLGGIDALKTVAGGSSNFGVPSVSVDTPSPWASLTQDLAGAGGQELIRSMFNNQPGTATLFGGTSVPTAPSDYWKQFQ